MSKHHNILPTAASFFNQVQEKLRVCENSKQSFSSSCSIAGDSYKTIKCPHPVVFNKHSILYFGIISIYQNIFR